MDKEELNDRVLFTGYLSGDKKLSCLVDSSVAFKHPDMSKEWCTSRGSFV